MIDFQTKCIEISWMKPYLEYKDSNVEGIEGIPENWNVVKLKKIIQFLTDFAANGSFADLRKNVQYLDGAGYSRLVRLTDLRVNFENEGIYVNEHAHKFLRKSELFGDEVLIANVGAYAGYVCKMPTLGIKCTLGPNMYLLRFKSKLIDNNFVLYVLMSNYCQEQLKIRATSTAQPKLNKDDVKETIIFVPPIPEQQAIANFLDRETSRIDTLIDKKQRFIELLEEKRSALISHAVTKGLDPDVPMKNSGIEWIGEIPEKWEVNKLKHSVSINPNVLPENTDPEFLLKYVDIGNVGLGKMVDLPKEMKFKDAPSRARKIVQENDIIISTVRTYLKAILHIINPEPNLIVSTGFAVLRPRPFVNHRYLFYLIRSNQFIYSVMSHSEGVSYPAINSSSLGDLPICYPTFPEQQAIASYLDSETSQIDILIEKIKQSIEYLKEYRTALISDAVTGKIDFRGLVCE